MATSHGRFVWYDLMTTDLPAAQAFYTNLTGWKLTPFEGGPMQYDMWTVGENTLGGSMPLPEEAKKMGAPPHWLAYVAVPDIHKTAAQVGELGGTVMVPPQEIPNVGQFCVLADPTGAVIAAFQPAGDMEVPYGDDIPNGFFSWHELASADWKKAHDFYADLFGWVDSDAMDMGPGGTYQMYKVEGMNFALGGMFNKMPEMPVSAWLYYVKVADVDAAVAYVQENGGKLLNGPMEVPGGDRVAQCMDPQGAAFAVHGK